MSESLRIPTIKRITRHARISWSNLGIPKVPTPRFLILFITSICNLKCEHCFYWRNLNRSDDLSVEEIFALSDELGRIETLNLSGGEPFLRKEIAEICHYFIHNNKVEQIYIPTNGYFSDKTYLAVNEILKDSSLKILAIEISLDGTTEYHNRLRGSDHSFQNAIRTHDALAQLQKTDSRLRIHGVSTVTGENIDEVRRLTEFLYIQCPAMDHHNIALIRGDRKNPSLEGPKLEAFEELYAHVRNIWAKSEEGRFGSIVEPMLQWAKVQTARDQKQIIPCRAGILSGVIYANGDVSFCETLPPLGNLRKQSFKEIWYSKEAQALRRSIRRKECYCTNEVFLWPSITFQPYQLCKAIWHAKAWRKPGRTATPGRIT
jgi:MoaA/NifB/PqqE/SkfB family radical SAM enzyme